MKLATKLLIAPVLTALLVFGAGQLNAWLTMNEAQTNQESAKEKSDNLRVLGSVHEQLGFIHAQMYRTIALISSLDDKAIKGFRNEIATQLAGIKRLTGSLIGGEGSDVVLQDAVKKTAELSDKYLAQTDMAIDLSSVDPNTGIAALRSADESFAALSKTLSDAVDHMDRRATEELVISNQHVRRTNLLLAAAALAAAGVAIFLSWLAQRRVVRDLHHAVKVAGAVSTGNLTLRADTDRADEVGDLMRALDAMTVQLRLSMGEVLQSSDQIRTASAEIATGNMDLSSRTEQAAANLQQTSASMAQLTGTVQQSTEASYRANELAASAADVAARGGVVVGEVVDTMQDINQSSRRIADIIGVIDGIAFQTNILALNAAVEAARAGEQGRGFAVVASEVRSLAQRSAQAAKEIKSLIDTSVEKVEIGTRLVADAGSTMNEIVASVKQVSDMIGEITSAAAEQSQGIGQISSAVTHLDNMTQQNAALVEESAAAAQSLSTQAQRLREVVNQFQIGQDSVQGGVPGVSPGRPVDPPPASAHPATLVEGGVNLDNAIEAHAQWRVKLRRAVENREKLDADTIARDNCCDLGRWLHGSGRSQHGGKPAFSTLIERHREFHEEVGRVAVAINRGEFEQADAALTGDTAFSRASGAVGAAIIDFRKELKGATGRQKPSAPSPKAALRRPELRAQTPQAVAAADDGWETF